MPCLNLVLEWVLHNTPICLIHVQRALIIDTYLWLQKMLQNITQSILVYLTGIHISNINTCEVKWKITQLCSTLFRVPMDYSPPSSSVHGILQARILEWVAISFSSRYSQPKDWTLVSCITGRFITLWATRECNDGQMVSIYLDFSILLYDVYFWSLQIASSAEDYNLSEPVQNHHLQRTCELYPQVIPQVYIYTELWFIYNLPVFLISLLLLWFGELGNGTQNI